MTDFKQYLLDEFVEDYQEGLLTRREALKLIAGITGSAALASSMWRQAARTFGTPVIISISYMNK